MADYSWIFGLLLDVEEFANLNRLYGLRDRVALAYDALTEDVERIARLNDRILAQSKVEADSSLDMPKNSVLKGNVLLFPAIDRRSNSSLATTSLPSSQ